jgi:hypothetical protein
MLADALSHDTGLAVIDAEAFFERYGGSVRPESSGNAVESFTARESEVVGITRVYRASGFSQAE